MTTLTTTTPTVTLEESLESALTDNLAQADWARNLMAIAVSHRNATPTDAYWCSAVRFWARELNRLDHTRSAVVEIFARLISQRDS